MEQVLLASVFLLPLLAATANALLRHRARLAEALNLLFPFATLAAFLAFFHTWQHDPSTSIVLFEWFEGVSVSFQADPLSIVFAFLILLLWPIATLYSAAYLHKNHPDSRGHFFTFFSLAIASSTALTMAGNFLTLFIFYECLTFSTYPLVTYHKDQKSTAAGRLYLITLLSTSTLFLLPTMIWVWNYTGNLEFTANSNAGGPFPAEYVKWLVILMAFGCAKMAIMPFHRWLPSAMVAPLPVSALLHAVAVVKAGVFCTAKLLIYVVGPSYFADFQAGEFLLYFAAFTVLTASTIAAFQQNLKKMLAYSTVSQLSYMLLGIATMQPLAIVGMALHMLSHGFAKIVMFFAVGAIYTSTQKTKISQINGIGRDMPWTMSAFTIAAISLIGLPPLAGFVSKWFLIEGSLEAGMLLPPIVITISSVINTLYLTPIIFRAFFLPRTDPTPATEVPLPMIIATLLPLTLCFTLIFFQPPITQMLLGIFPS